MGMKKKFEGKVIVLGAGSVGKDLAALGYAKLWDAAYPKFHEEAGKFPDFPLIFGTAGADPYREDGSGSITTFDAVKEESKFMVALEQSFKDGSFVHLPVRKFGKTHAFSAKKYGKWRAIELKKKYNRGKNNPPL